MADLEAGNAVMAGTGSDGTWPPAADRPDALLPHKALVHDCLTGRKWLDFIIGFAIAPVVFTASSFASMALGAGFPQELSVTSFLVIAISLPTLVGYMTWAVVSPAKHVRSSSVAGGSWIGTGIVLCVFVLRVLGGDGNPRGCFLTTVGNTISMLSCGHVQGLMQ